MNEDMRLLWEGQACKGFMFSQYAAPMLHAFVLYECAHTNINVCLYIYIQIFYIYMYIYIPGFHMVSYTVNASRAH